MIWNSIKKFFKKEKKALSGDALAASWDSAVSVITNPPQFPAFPYNHLEVVGVTKPKAYIPSKLRIAVDLDKTICELKLPNQNYIDVSPLPGAIETLQELKKQGVYIIIFTARGQVTHNGDLDLRKKHTEPVIHEWLKKHNIPYDEVVLTKVHVDFFIDDKSIEFKNNWNEIKERLLKEIPNV